jgi:hypothetical protein
MQADRAALAMAIADLSDLLDELPAVDTASDAEIRDVRVAWERFLRAWLRALEVRLRAAAAGKPAMC